MTVIQQNGKLPSDQRSTSKTTSNFVSREKIAKSTNLQKVSIRYSCCEIRIFIHFFTITANVKFRIKKKKSQFNEITIFNYNIHIYIMRQRNK